MKIDLQAYHNKYHQCDKFIDNWQAGIKLLPFNSNPASAYDKGCGLLGVVGEFMRVWINDGTKAFEDFDESAIEPVASYLRNQRMMPSEQVLEFTRMLVDVMLVNGNLNITDSAFLKYLPLVSNDERISEKDRKKYKDGQTKIAAYLYAMLPENMEYPNKGSLSNIFTRILHEALNPFESNEDIGRTKDYYILPYIKDSFTKDLAWLLEQEEIVKVKYLPLLLYFYACYSVTQAIVNLAPRNNAKIVGPAPFYFILNSEKASVNHDAVLRGWSYQIPKVTLDKLFGKSQALDILNSVLGEKVGFYPEVYEKLLQTPFDVNRDACIELLELYQKEKREVFSNRRSEEGSIDELDVTINSYEEFILMLEQLCTGLQSPSYVSRMRKKVIDLLSVRLLQSRRGNYVLVLDNEMLTFLIALFTRGKKVKLDVMYKCFNSYGIFFNRGTRNAIEDYLLKLNLLDRKSDSGEAQYVRVVL